MINELKIYPYINPDEGLGDPTPDRREVKRRYYLKNRKRILAKNKAYRERVKTCQQRSQPVDP